MDAKHTQGPWDHNGYSVEGPDGRLICNMSGWKGAGVTEANACLIAAAPELLEACAAIVAWCDKNPPAGDALYCINQARAAIAKAEGR